MEGSPPSLIKNLLDFLFQPFAVQIGFSNREEGHSLKEEEKISEKIYEKIKNDLPFLLNILPKKSEEVTFFHLSHHLW